MIQDLQALSSWVDEQASRVIEVGSTCALGGDGAWDAVLKDHGVTALPPDERQKHITEGPKRSRGALPIEVRLCITSIYERARQAVRALYMKASSPEEHDFASKIEKRLSVIVEEVTRAHLQRVTPAAPTTSSIFANARATTPSYGGGVKAGMNQMKCVACGAPRMTQATEIGPCVYCGGKIA